MLTAKRALPGDLPKTDAWGYSGVVQVGNDVWVAGVTALRADGNVFASLSHQLVAEYREYERLSTTVINAYVGPVMSRHLRTLGNHPEHVNHGRARAWQSSSVNTWQSSAWRPRFRGCLLIAARAEFTSGDLCCATLKAVGAACCHAPSYGSVEEVLRRQAGEHRSLQT